MRVRVGVLLALLLAMSFGLYQEPAGASCVPNTISAYAHETITVSSTSIGFSSALFNQGSGQAQAALVTIETNPIRWWADGIDPTATVGHLVAVSSTIEVCGFANVQHFRMIRQAADATAQVSYFR